MLAELDEFLTQDRFLTCDRGALLRALKRHIAQHKPSCLMHPHGFLVMLLKRTPDEEWRLHLWPSDRDNGYGMPGRIHTHDKHVDSRILLGTLTNITYAAHYAGDNLESSSAREVEPGGLPLYEGIYRGDKYQQQTANALKKVATRIHVEQISTNLMVAGEHYRIERHTYHEAVVSPGLSTCTLVCMHSPSPGTVKIVGVDGFEEELTFQRSEHPGHLYLQYL